MSLFVCQYKTICLYILIFISLSACLCVFLYSRLSVLRVTVYTLAYWSIAISLDKTYFSLFELTLLTKKNIQQFDIILLYSAEYQGCVFIFDRLGACLLGIVFFRTLGFRLSICLSLYVSF